MYNAMPHLLLLAQTFMFVFIGYVMLRGTYSDSHTPAKVWPRPGQRHWDVVSTQTECHDTALCERLDNNTPTLEGINWSKYSSISSHTVSERQMPRKNTSYLHNNISHTNRPLVLCNISTASNGAWILEASHEYIVPICCSWDAAYLPNNDKRLCSNKFKENPKNNPYDGQGQILTQSGGSGCGCTKQIVERTRPYVWVPHSCALSPWNAQKFCSLLKGRKVLLIGDSTMQQTASVLMNAIQWRQGGCQKDIFSAMADTLVHRSFGSHNRGLVWTEWVAKILPDIVVISAGAHIKKDSDYDRVISEVVKDIQVLKHKNPKVTVVWKTQQPGGCFSQVTDEIWNASTWAKYPGKGIIGHCFTTEMLA
jgi:hypothetical protein